MTPQPEGSLNEGPPVPMDCQRAHLPRRRRPRYGLFGRTAADPDEDSGRVTLGILRRLPCLCTTDRAGPRCNGPPPQTTSLSHQSVAPPPALCPLPQFFRVIEAFPLSGQHAT